METKITFKIKPIVIKSIPKKTKKKCWIWENEEDDNYKD